MLKSIGLAFLLLLAGIGSVAYAAPGAAFKTMNISCSDYLATPSQRAMDVQWVSGMIVGLVSKTSQIVPQDVTSSQLESRVTAYCKSQPKETLFVAAAMIAKPYMKQR